MNKEEDMTEKQLARQHRNETYAPPRARSQ